MKHLLAGITALVLFWVGYYLGHQRGLDQGAKIVLDEIISICSMYPDDVVTVKNYGKAVFECIASKPGIGI